MYSNRHLGQNYLTTKSVCTISTDVIYLCVARITCPYRPRLMKMSDRVSQGWEKV